MTPTQQEARAFAEKIRDMGFTVYLAESGTYGFITDESESRVLTFSVRDCSLGGTYGPPSKQSGTGWRMEEATWDLKMPEDVRRALYSAPPPWCGRGWKRLSDVRAYLALYGASSRFVRI